MPNVSILSSSSTQLDSHTAFILSKSANISIDVRPSSAGGVTSHVGGQSEVGEFAAKVSNIISSSPREIVDTHSNNNNINKSRDCNAAPQLTNIDTIGDKSGAQGMYNIVLTNMFLQGTKIPIHAHQQLPSDRESFNNNKRGMDLDRHASMNGKDDHRQGDPVSPLPTIDLSDVPDTDTTVRLATTNRTPVSHPRSIQSSPSLAPVASLTDDSGMGPLTIDRSASPKVSGKKYRSYAHSGDVEEICTGSAGRSVNSIRVDTRLNHSETQDISAYIRRSRNRNMVNNNTGESQTEGQRHDVIPTQSQENLRPEKAKLCNEEVYQKDRIISTSSSELLPIDQVIRCDSPIRATAPRKQMSPLSALDETTNPITSVVPVAVDSCGKRADNPLMKSLCVLRSRQQCEGGSLNSGNADGNANIPGRPYYATTTVQGSLDRDGIINMIKELRQAVSNNNNITNNNTCEINTHSSKQGLADENQRLREALERQQALITSFLSKMATMVDSRATDSDGTARGVTLQQSLKDMGMAGGITSLSLPTGEVGLGDTIPGSGCTPSLQGESLPLSRTSFVGSMKNGVLSKSVGNNLCDISNNNINIVNNTAREMELISKLPNVMPSGVICDDVTMKEGMCVIRSEGSLTDNRSDNSNHTNNNNIYDNQQGDANKFNTQEATHISISPDVSHRPAPVVFDVSIDCLRGLDKTCRDKNSNNKNNNMTRRQPQSTDDVTNIITIHTGDSLPRNTPPNKKSNGQKTTKNGIVIDINKVSLQQQDDEKKREDRVMKQEPHHHQRQRTSSLLSRGNNYQHVCWNNKPTVTLALRYALLPGRVNQRMLDSVLEVMGRYETDQQDTSTPTPIVQSDSTEAQNRGTTATNIPIHPQQLQQWYMILLKEEGTFVFRGLYVASKRMVPCAVENIISTDNNNNNNNNPPMMAITTLKRIFGAGPVGLSVCAQQSSNGGSAYTDKPYQQEGYPIASSPRYYKYNTCTKQFEEQQSSEVGSTTDAMTIGKMQRLNWQKILY